MSLFINKTLPLNNLKTRTAANAKTSVFVICVEAIIYLLLFHLHDCTFKVGLADSQKNLCHLLDRKPFKNDEKCFLFRLQALFILKIFKFLS